MTGSASKIKVGVIGLGLMGSALADVLMSQGIDLRVWNRSRDKCERFAAAGVPVGDSVETVANESEVLVVCLTDHSASMDVLQSGKVTKQLEGKTLVLLTTMTAEDSLVTAAWAAENGLHYLDGAILAYPREVRDMAAMIVYSGPRAVFDACKPVLDAMGGMPRWVGDKGATAIRFASAIYTVYYAHALGIIQGAAMCAAAGLHSMYSSSRQPPTGTGPKTMRTCWIGSRSEIMPCRRPLWRSTRPVSARIRGCAINSASAARCLG